MSDSLRVRWAHCAACRYGRDYYGTYCVLLPWNDRRYQVAIDKYVAWSGTDCGHYPGKLGPRVMPNEQRGFKTIAPTGGGW